MSGARCGPSQLPEGGCTVVRGRVGVDGIFGSVSEPCDVHCVSVPVPAWHENNFETVGRSVCGFTVDPDDNLGCFGDPKHMF